MNDNPNVHLVTASDLGSGLHPENKFGYGARGSRVALSLVYHQNIEGYGPIYQTHKIEGNKLRISFTHVGKGLAFANCDKLQGFSIAGKDGSFVWADAVIEGNTVVLSSSQVANPTDARYAWGGVAWANLFNKDGLPALPFYTDHSTAPQ